MAIDDDRSFLATTTSHAERPGDTANMNPVFAQRLAAAIRQARAEGIMAGVGSGYRGDDVTGSAFDKAGYSAHGYGLASDISGIGVRGSDTWKRWNQIAQQNGLNNPYLGTASEGPEFNHWQLPPQPLNRMDPSLLANLKAARATGDWSKVWAAAAPIYGTTLNASNTPVKGALAAETGPESAGAGAPKAASEGPLDTRQLIYNKLTAAGLQPHQAMGALYGLGGESATFNTGDYNPNDPGGSIGIGQWNGDRRTALEAFAKNRGTAVTDPNTQADFLVDELTNPKAATYQPGVLDAMQKAGNAADATNTWVAKYERPKVNNWQQRFDAGPARVGSLDQNNNFTLGTAPASNTTTTPTTPGAAPAVAAAPAADKPWWQKAFDAPTDAQGNPTGAKSPIAQAAAALTGKDKGSSLEQFKQAQEEEAPQAVKNQAGQAPGARNTSPMGGALLPSVPQTYGQTINSLAQPLTWNSAPPRAPQMPAAGLQGQLATQVPGTTLTSFQPPQGIGYGVDPNIGYGYG